MHKNGFSIRPVFWCSHRVLLGNTFLMLTSDYQHLSKASVHNCKFIKGWYLSLPEYYPKGETLPRLKNKNENIEQSTVISFCKR